ncbi:MIP/aquaporin family protein [Parabacteroides sp. PF5-6]|uniref:MIP/aquaporin family protein n=1 Tax=Parabacteroides sp. PF5-6 TaxID=1742403 RepID=UPI0024053D27|nr:MIP/aquaporin family protein [Parabacteroides sp. PF5-6]MDF9829825.1 glycerol uptake facilitator protein [Parabacteroides sp. PF5-6]
MNPFIAELLGTMLLILMGAGVCANVLLTKTKGHGAGWMVITTAWAMGVFIGVVVAGPYSGAHLNPAVTFGLALAGQFAWNAVGGYILAQMLGAALGALLVWLVYKDHFDATEEAPKKLAVFSTNAEIRNPAINFFTELVGTFVLMFVVFYISDGSFDSTKTGDAGVIGLGSVGAIPVSFTVWVIGLALGGPTGYAINPARDLGPRIMHALLPIKGKGGSDWGYAWVPVCGPLAGAAVAALLFGAI